MEPIKIDPNTIEFYNGVAIVLNILFGAVNIYLIKKNWKIKLVHKRISGDSPPEKPLNPWIVISSALAPIVAKAMTESVQKHITPTPEPTKGKTIP